MIEENDVKSKKMFSLCSLVKELIHAGDYKQAFQKVYESMAEFPNSPEPHNLLGILLEKKGEHLLAMKHFRIAWILDPTYQPANQNISNFCNLHSCIEYAYAEEDCIKNEKPKYNVIYDDWHIGRVVRIK